MGKTHTNIPVAELKQNIDRVLHHIRDFEDPIFITQSGRTAAVMMNPASYERIEHHRELLRLLLQGEQEIIMGNGYDLETVLQEAETLLANT